VLPKWKEHERSSTTIADAYIRPLVSGHLDSLKTRFAGQGVNKRIAVIKSNGGEMTLEAAAKLRYDAPAYVPSEVEDLTEIEKTSLQRWREEQQQHVSHGGGVVTGASGMSRNGRQRTPARRGID
jgi:hypothetical protein